MEISTDRSESKPSFISSQIQLVEDILIETGNSVLYPTERCVVTVLLGRCRYKIKTRFRIVIGVHRIKMRNHRAIERGKYKSTRLY
jgi:hypothetical protein